MAIGQNRPGTVPSGFAFVSVTSQPFNDVTTLDPRSFSPSSSSAGIFSVRRRVSANYRTARTVHYQEDQNRTYVKTFFAYTFLLFINFLCKIRFLCFFRTCMLQIPIF
jgi:hypothetical protein